MKQPSVKINSCWVGAAHFQTQTAPGHRTPHITDRVANAGAMFSSTGHAGEADDTVVELRWFPAQLTAAHARDLVRSRTQAGLARDLLFLRRLLQGSVRAPEE